MHELINAAILGKNKNVEVKLDLNVDGEVWQAYEAHIAYRDILFFCKQGTATFFVDSYGERNTIELYDWSKD